MSDEDNLKKKKGGTDKKDEDEEKEPDAPAAEGVLVSDAILDALDEEVAVPAVEDEEEEVRKVVTDEEEEGFGEDYNPDEWN